MLSCVFDVSVTVLECTRAFGACVSSCLLGRFGIGVCVADVT